MDPIALACSREGESDNPFVVESPERLTASRTARLFVKEFSDVETVRQRKHTMIWGSRGSGKSMLLRFLEPGCQVQEDPAFMSSQAAFLGVYCPFKEGQFNKTELQALPDLTAMIVAEHMINLAVTDKLLGCLSDDLGPDCLRADRAVLFVRRVVSLFERASIQSSVAEANDAADPDKQPVEWLRQLLSAENKSITRFVKRVAQSGGSPFYEGTTSGYHDFLLPLMRLAQELLPPGVPIFLLLDDVDKLTEQQQRIVNTWVANRDQAVLCVKIAARRERYLTFLTRDGGLIEPPHDYSEIDITELYTRSKSEYFEKVKRIAERRLDLSEVPTKSIEQFLPSDANEARLLELIREETAQEWERVGRPGRQRDYVDRLALARLFQHLRDHKKRKSYAGFGNLVHMSSGVIRDFLEPCYLAFDQYRNQEGLAIPQVTGIPADVQDEVIFKWSEEYVLQKFDDMRKVLPSEEHSKIDRLANLVGSLGQLFYERLHDRSAREARLFSFTVRDSVGDDVADILRLGVEFRYFQLRTYTTKEGGGREPWYILNRRLCPAYKLDPTGFMGRVSLTGDLLRLACSDPRTFLRLRLRQSEEDSQSVLFELDSSGASHE